MELFFKCVISDTEKVLEKVGKTNVWMWTSISETGKSSRVSQISVDAEAFRSLTFRDTWDADARTALQKIFLRLYDVKGGMLVFVTNHRKILSLVWSNMFFTSFLA